MPEQTVSFPLYESAPAALLREMGEAKVERDEARAALAAERAAREDAGRVVERLSRRLSADIEALGAERDAARLAARAFLDFLATRPIAAAMLEGSAELDGIRGVAG